MKTAFESSVLNVTPAPGLGLLREPGCHVPATGYTRHGYASSATRVWERPEQSGVQSSTYRITGYSFEQVNLNPSVGQCEAQQAARFGAVLDEGRSLRCSLSMGNPCTWR